MATLEEVAADLLKPVPEMTFGQTVGQMLSPSDQQRYTLRERFTTEANAHLVMAGRYARMARANGHMFTWDTDRALRFIQAAREALQLAEFRVREAANAPGANDDDPF